jgi:DNA-directed RNA polymerase II subunit RPB7
VVSDRAALHVLQTYSPSDKARTLDLDNAHLETLKMFFLRYLEREINIHPSFFGNNVHDRLKDQLYADMEGSCNGEYYVVCIMDIYNISPGKVTPGSGEATFVILYRAILWKPFKGETVGWVL